MKIELEKNDIKLIKKRWIKRMRHFIKTLPDSNFDVGNTFQITFHLDVEASWLKD